MRFAAFLRGINTGKQRMNMDEFVKVMEKSEFHNVKSYLATGNLVFDYNEEGSKSIVSLKTKVEGTINNLLAELTGWDIGVQVREKHEIENIIKEYDSLVSRVGYSDEHHIYVMFCEDESIFKTIEEVYLDYPHGEGEKIYGMGRDFLWRVKKGDTLNKFGSHVLGSKKFKDKLTSRNINTVIKVWELISK